MEEKFVIKDVDSFKIIDKTTGETVLESSYIGATDYEFNTRSNRDSEKHVEITFGTHCGRIGQITKQVNDEYLVRFEDWSHYFFKKDEFKEIQ